MSPWTLRWRWMNWSPCDPRAAWQGAAMVAKAMLATNHQLRYVVLAESFMMAAACQQQASSGNRKMERSKQASKTDKCEFQAVERRHSIDHKQEVGATRTFFDFVWMISLKILDPKTTTRAEPYEVRRRDSDSVSIPVSFSQDQGPTTGACGWISTIGLSVCPPFSV